MNIDANFDVTGIISLDINIKKSLSYFIIISILYRLPVVFSIRFIRLLNFFIFFVFFATFIFFFFLIIGKLQLEIHIIFQKRMWRTQKMTYFFAYYFLIIIDMFRLVEICVFLNGWCIIPAQHCLNKNALLVTSSVVGFNKKIWRKTYLFTWCLVWVLILGCCFESFNRLLWNWTQFRRDTFV